MVGIRQCRWISTELYDWLVKEAADQNRTVYGQINHILKSYRARIESGKVPVIRRGSVVALQKVG